MWSRSSTGRLVRVPGEQHIDADLISQPPSFLIVKMGRRSSTGRLVRVPCEQRIDADLISQLPFDLIVKMGSFLSYADFCALCSCSKFWLEVSRTDSLWFYLSKQRWPYDLHIRSNSSPPEGTWRAFYAKRHQMLESVYRFLVTVEVQATAARQADFN